MNSIVLHGLMFHEASFLNNNTCQTTSVWCAIKCMFILPLNVFSEFSRLNYERTYCKIHFKITLHID